MDPDQTAQAGVDPCWSQTHYVGFVMTRLIYPNDTMMLQLDKRGFKLLTK
jgi:hypothetical protein